MSEETPIIEVRDLYQRFGDHHVLRGVTAHVNRGETLVLLGGSGGGKSVLIKHFIGLISPYSGQVIVNGEDISNMNERQLGKVRQAMGMMFQSGALFDSMTVGQNIAFPLRERGITDEKEILKRVLECLDIVKLPGQASKMPADLSGGMRKRVALARAIVDRPECVLYDEPHAGLDPITGDAIDHLIKDLQKVHGMTNVIITHEMRSVFRIADRVIFLKDGQIYWEGTPQEMKDSGDLELLDFIDGIARED
jgi:phospholipid/cholesterol/gamma-HCH transport system ATP-binding protein